MTNSDKFSVIYGHGYLRLRCDVCHALDFGSGEIFDWAHEEDMNLAGLVSHGQAHWAQIHNRTEEQ